VVTTRTATSTSKVRKTQQGHRVLDLSARVFKSLSDQRFPSNLAIPCSLYYNMCKVLIYDLTVGTF